ncbi:MAG: glycoside hydrolase family 15 protein, partial [Lapillicoccus sp.]
FAAGARLDRLDVGDWNAVETCVAAIESRWTEPDAGIWELEPENWTHSRLICAAGLRAAGAVDPAAQGAAWRALADRIVSETAADGLHPSGRWQRSPSDERVDASLLLPALRGAIPPGDPRSVATVEAVRAELGRKGYVYRFRHDGRPLADAEGAFTLCGFHMAMAAHQQGEQTEAMRRFERNRAACGPPGLFTEEFDIEQRQLRGNLPQAFVHAVLLESTKRLADDPATPMH